MAKSKVRKFPRRGGDILLDTDVDDWYAEYLQCSYACDVGHIAESRERLAQTAKEPALGEKPKPPSS